MASADIPAATTARHDQILDISRKFMGDFIVPIGPEMSQEKFLAIYHSEVEWFDHAFHIRRVGHEAVLGLKKAFLHCNQPFVAHEKAIMPTAEGAVIETLWKGRCVNDIVRPNGEVAGKGTGKWFQTHVCMVLKISQDGLITRIDEYYTKLWDEGIVEEDFTIVKGSFSKL